MKNRLYLALLALLSASSFSHAALNNLGNGLVNDTVQGITWLKNANLAKTSCDANDVLWQNFDPTTAVGNTRSKAQICAAGGTLIWTEAASWIAVLNVHNYLGHNDWRHPGTPQPDATCEQTNAISGDGFGYNCRGSEMGHLFNLPLPAGLGNPNEGGTGATGGTMGNGCGPNCFANIGPFSNIQADGYWSNRSTDANNAFGFYMTTGIQNNIAKFNAERVWPVRLGLSAAQVTQAVPLLPIWALVLISLMLLFLGWVSRSSIREKSEHF